MVLNDEVYWDGSGEDTAESWYHLRYIAAIKYLKPSCRNHAL